MIAYQFTIAKANKGKTITILTQDEYKQKKTFIQENNFRIINNNPTQQYQQEIMLALKQSKSVIKKETWKLQA
jgi:hypothetical protein